MVDLVVFCVYFGGWFGLIVVVCCCGLAVGLTYIVLFCLWFWLIGWVIVLCMIPIVLF